MALCPGCGNEVLNPAKCPICKAGRAPKRRARPLTGHQLCPRCQDPLEAQDWEGVTAFSCPNCRGSFFPDHSLETVLNKLRATCSPVTIATVLAEFKDRFTRPLPEAIRYKDCPFCLTVMTRRNYGGVSGVIIDVCSTHGTWVDEAAFAELADFISRGGDMLAHKATRNLARREGKAGEDDPSLLQRFFGP